MILNIATIYVCDKEVGILGCRRNGNETSSLFLDWRDKASLAKTDDSIAKSPNRVCSVSNSQKKWCVLLCFALFCCRSSWLWWRFCDIWPAFVWSLLLRVHVHVLLRINWRLLDYSFEIYPTRGTAILCQSAVSYSIETASSSFAEEEVVQRSYQFQLQRQLQLQPYTYAAVSVQGCEFWGAIIHAMMAV